MVGPVDGRRSSASAAARPFSAQQPWGSNGGRQPPSSSSPLSTSSPHRCSFHIRSTGPPPTASTSLPPPPRDPLVPRYSLPSYPIVPIPPVAFLGCSLDVSDIDGARPLHLERARVRERSKRHRQPSASASTALLRCSPSPPPSVCSLALPSTRPCDPVPPHPFPHRFQHSPNVVQLPCTPFSSTYHPALRDPLPSFDFSLHRPSQLPARFGPLGGCSDEGRWREPQSPRRKRRGGGEDAQRRRGKRDWKGAVSARVECWRGESPAEEESQQSRGQWRAFHALDVAAVQSLGLMVS